jgi:NAD(P)-dependent dehydrogenase (short-subunit alcohol dehydrogenase family)
MREPFDLSGRAAVVTGAGSGIGRACAQVLAGAGAAVVCADIDQDEAEATARLIEEAGGTARAQRTDVSRKEEVPLGIVGEPEDIAYAVLYLVSDASRFVTGQILRPNGGVTMPW